MKTQGKKGKIKIKKIYIKNKFTNKINKFITYQKKRSNSTQHASDNRKRHSLLVIHRLVSLPCLTKASKQ